MGKLDAGQRNGCTAEGLEASHCQSACRLDADRPRKSLYRPERKHPYMIKIECRLTAIAKHHPSISSIAIFSRQYCHDFQDYFITPADAQQPVETPITMSR